MQIQNGKLYENRTWRYLVPCLKSYGEELKKHLSNLLKLKVGISDFYTETTEDCIYICFQTTLFNVFELERTRYVTAFTTFLQWVKYQPYYYTDYVYSLTECTHVLVLKIPEIHKESFENFKLGKYSEMYSKVQVEEYFKLIENKDSNLNVAVRNQQIIKSRNVLNRNRDLLDDFVKEVNERFKTNLTKEDLEGTELDFPIDPKEECV